MMTHNRSDVESSSKRGLPLCVHFSGVHAPHLCNLATGFRTGLRWTITLFLALVLLFSQAIAIIAQEAELPAIHFTVVDIFLESGEEPLAAWQIDFSATVGKVKIVGIEGGEHPEFRKPPYYDPEALQNERVILAAFSTADAASLPTGRTRIASIHLQIEGQLKPEFLIELKAAAKGNGVTIKPGISVNERSQNEE